MRVRTDTPRPSWKSGFARSAAESMFPGLWHRKIGQWAAVLGPTGVDILHDVSGWGHDGPMAGFTPATDWVIDEMGYSLNYDATDNEIQVPVWDKLPLGDTERTVVTWVKPTNASAGRMFAWGDSDSGESFGWTIETVSTDHVLFRHQGGNIRYPGAVVGAWNCVATVVLPSTTDTDGVECWINGIKRVGTRNGGSNQTLNTISSDLFIGENRGTGGANFDGLIAITTLYDRALSDNELRLLYEIPYADLMPKSQAVGKAAVAPPAGFVHSQAVMIG